MSSESAITVRHISKVYSLGLTGRTKSFAKIFGERIRHPLWGGPKRERFTALDDVSFDVSPGEAVGVIGKNGAGKSTLLKILTRITPPSTGYIEMSGSVGSLLEVGTGFHPELTGMENVYLNGTILGMSKRDIDRRLDEIIAFAEVDRFLDTPVKRYSSGMRVRLAFAVAAHLEPDVLIVDEVLSVGDYAFQAKCLEKMRSVVANEGRTVLYVSHNLVTVEHLCPRCLLLADGRLVFDGPTDETVSNYMNLFPHAQRGSQAGVFDLSAGDRSETTYDEVLKRLELRPAGGPPSDTIRMGEWLRIEIDVEGFDVVTEPYVLVTVGSTSGLSRNDCLFRMTSGMMPLQSAQRRPSRETISIDIPSLPLTPGQYFLDVHLKDQSRTIDFVKQAAEFNVLPADVLGNGYQFDGRDGFFSVPFEWELRPTGADPAERDGSAARYAL